MLNYHRSYQGTSKEKLYQELRLESLQLRRWFRKLCLFPKFFKNEYHKYLINIIPVKSTPYTTRNMNSFCHLNTKRNFFKNSFSNIKYY